jgi:hypothetical protein
MAVTCYKNYGTPRNSTGVPATRTRYALASEIGLLAGNACVLARRWSPWPKKQLWQLALSHTVVRWMHVWGAPKSIGSSSAGWPRLRV